MSEEKDIYNAINKLRDDLHKYSDTADAKIERRLDEKFEALLINMDNVKADAYDDVRELRDDIKEQRKSDVKGRRWLIAIVLSLAMAAMSAVGGYFISVDVLSTRVDALFKDQSDSKEWQLTHHDKIELGFEKSKTNEANIIELRKDFRDYVKGR